MKGNVKAGLIALLSIVLFIWLVNFLKGSNMLRSGRTFYAVYSDVNGLQPSSQVLINGLPVGSVQRIYFDKGQSGKLVVELWVDTDLSFSRNTVAKLVGSGFLSAKAIALEVGHEGREAQSGDTLKSQLEQGIGSMLLGQVGPFKDKLEGLIEATDSTLSNLRELTKLENRNQLLTTLKTLDRTLQHYDRVALHIDAQFGPEGSLKQTLDKASASFDHMATLTAKLAAAPLDTSLQRLDHILEKIDDAHGSLGLLVNDPALYGDLKQVTVELGRLLQDVRLNPKRYVHFSIFGKKGKSYASPAEQTD